MGELIFDNLLINKAKFYNVYWR